MLPALSPCPARPHDQREAAFDTSTRLDFEG
jgi:hypothetical protein